MVSRFYKPAFLYFIFFEHIINEKEEKMQEKICGLLEKRDIAPEQ